MTGRLSNVRTFLDPDIRRVLSHQKELRLRRPLVLSSENIWPSPSRDRFSTVSKTKIMPFITRDSVSTVARTLADSVPRNHWVRTRAASKRSVAMRKRLIREDGLMDLVCSRCDNAVSARADTREIAAEAMDTRVPGRMAVSASTATCSAA